MSFLILLLCGTLGAAAAAAPQPAVVIVPVADVWSRPLAPREKPSDALRETQVLLDERVIIHESSGSWVRIEAIEQPEFTHHNVWEGYPGWIKKSVLAPFLERGRMPPVNTFQILKFSETAVGTPYLWGGLSQKGFDCSGLIHRAYREIHLVIPRDAHEQWMKAKPIRRAQLKPADLIFSANADAPKKITHVALYAGDGQIIEAPQSGMVVRKVSFKEKYGKDFFKVESGDTVDERVIYFGTFIQK